MNCETIAMSLVNAIFWLLAAGAFIAGFEGCDWWERRKASHVRKAVHHHG